MKETVEAFKNAPMWYRKAVLWLLGVILSMTGTGIGYIIWKGNAWIAKTEIKTFSTPEKRMETEQFMGRVVSDERYQEWFEHISDPRVHMSKQSKDSVYVTRAEQVEMIKSNALEDYQDMLRFKAHEEKQDRVNENIQRDLKLILRKLEQEE